MPLLLAGYMPGYVPKTSAPAPVVETEPPLVIKLDMSRKRRVREPKPPRPPKQPKGKGKRLMLPSHCWIESCESEEREGGFAVGFCKTHWMKIPRELRIDLLLSRKRPRDRFIMFVREALDQLAPTQAMMHSG